MFLNEQKGEITSQKGTDIMEELEELINKWDLIISTFKEEHDIHDISFKTWIKPLKIYKLDGNVITLTYSAGEMGIVYIEKRYLKFLEVTICEVMNKEYTIRLISLESGTYGAAF